jgi:hypothetical protein
MNKIGIIAEDDTDVKCLKILIKKIRPSIVLKGIGVGGGGNMSNMRKMEQWTRSLYAESCHFLLVVHDLDRNGATNALNDKNELMNKLKNALAKNPITQHCIIIPIEELEAWLLSDKHLNPENIVNPKQYLKKANKNYRTSDNEWLATQIDIVQISAKCPSFLPLKKFIEVISEEKDDN